MRNRLRWLGLGFLFVFAAMSSAKAQAPKFVFDTGEAAWGGERIQLPPEFAPDMKWVGEEDIRFAPGMMKAEAEDFFTYVLVFLLDKDADVSPENTGKEILAYYQGLSKSVMKGKGQEVDADKFTIQFKKDESVAEAPAGVEKEAVAQFTGVLEWIEPFATQKAQKLHIELQSWKHGEKPALFLCVSPKGRDAPIWKELRKIRASFKIED